MGSVGVLVYLRKWIGSVYYNHDGKITGVGRISNLSTCIYWVCNLEHLLILYSTNLLCKMV